MPGGSGEAVAAGTTPLPSEEAKQSVRAVRPTRVPGPAKSLLLWVALIAVFLGAFQMSNAGPPWLSWGLSMAVLVPLAAYWLITRVWRDAGRVQKALTAWRAGEVEEASRLLDFRPAQAVTRVQACHVRSTIALDRGDMAQVLVECQEGLKALTAARRRLTTMPAPGEGPSEFDFSRRFAGDRAVALAALGRVDEARAELAWAGEVPGRAQAFRVELFGHLQRGDWSAALLAANAHDPKLPMFFRDEVVVEVLRFVARSEGRDGAEGLATRTELTRADTVNYLRNAAPALLHAFEVAAGGAR